MRLKLSEKWVQKMISMPETSMGAQEVLVILKDGTRIQGIVFNGEILQASGPHQFSEKDIDDIIVLT